jgi:hypothetical protein
MNRAKNFETIFMKELVDPTYDAWTIKSKLIEAYPVSYVP